MDQNSSNGTDKRNWRERLGIGSKELPRISDDFRDEQPVFDTPPPRSQSAKAPAPVAHPAPMAPRPAPKAARPVAEVVPAPRAPAPRPAQRAMATPVVPDALAEKLKIQRAAAERLAEQRVQAARERAEAASVPPPQQAKSTRMPELNAGPKPKFSFAEEDAPSKAPPPVMPQRQAPPPPMQQARTQVPPPPSGYQPQMQSPLVPPRPSLGGDRQLPPQRPIQQQMPPPQQPAYQPQYRPQAPQGYRPIDPNTGYPQQSANPGLNPTYSRPQYGGGIPQAGAPRLPNPPMGRNPADNYGNDPSLGAPEYEQEMAPQPNARMMRPPMRPQLQPPSRNDDFNDDVFEQPAPRQNRRASATEYTQAYREESQYDDDPQRSRIPLILSLVGLALIAGFAGWYFTVGKSPMIATTGDNPPVIEAQEQPAKVTPEQVPEGQIAVPNTPTKKQIYDRIVGDQEVLGGQLTPTEETPVQPEAQSQPIPEPGVAPAAGQPETDDGTLPLPLPPPPGAGTGNNTQGALPGEADQNVSNVTPTSGIEEGQTALAPTPGDLPTELAANSTQAAPPSDTPAETENVSEPEIPAAAKKKPKIKIAAVEKPKVKEAKNIGAKPVVLVAASKTAAKANDDIQIEPPVDDAASLNPMQDNGNNLSAENPAIKPETGAAAPKKKRTLVELFDGDDAASAAKVASTEQPPAVEEEPPATKKKIAAEPAPPPPAATVTPNGYVVQLASFKTQNEAISEYKRMTSKYRNILGGLSSNIRQASVAGSTRYRLAVGPLSTRNAASQVCSKLLAAGERDCLIKKQ